MKSDGSAVTNAVVFVGPSLGRDRVAELTNAKIADPIRRGDLALFPNCDKFLILDGEFGQNLSVSPKEILRLLDARKLVIGAASMGALRASELDSFGMLGIGWVYRRFARCSVRRDDDVALIYSPLDFVPRTIPVVNVEYWMETLRRQGTVTRLDAAAVVRVARKVFFTDRTEQKLVQALRTSFGDERVDYLLTKTAGDIPDVKAMDAEVAIRALEKSGGFG